MSIYYGSAVSINAFPTYSTADLQRDLESDKLDANTRLKIEAEIARRATAKKSRKPKTHG
jgi:hypothetical protein